MRFYKNPFPCRCEKENRKAYGFKFRTFVDRFQVTPWQRSLFVIVWNRAYPSCVFLIVCHCMESSLPFLSCVFLIVCHCMESSLPFLSCVFLIVCHCMESSLPFLSCVFLIVTVWNRTYHSCVFLIVCHCMESSLPFLSCVFLIVCHCMESSLPFLSCVFLIVCHCMESSGYGTYNRAAVSQHTDTRKNTKSPLECCYPLHIVMLRDCTIFRSSAAIGSPCNRTQ